MALEFCFDSLKNAWDENDFISTGTIVNRSFVKCCLLKVILLNNCDIYCFVQIAVATHCSGQLVFLINDIFMK